MVPAHLRRLYSMVFLVIAVCTGASSQFEARFTGYVVDFPSFQRTNSFLAQLGGMERNQFVNVVRLRLRPTIFLGASTFLAIEHEVNSLYSSSRLRIVENVDRRPRQLVGLSWSPSRSEHHTLSHFVDRFFLRYTSDVTDMTIGRQRIAWGTGRVWNPTDLFNPINPTSFAKLEKDGIDAATARIHLGRFSDLTLVYNPEDEFRRNNAGFRLRTNVGRYDLSWMGGMFDERVVIGTDFAGNLFDAGVRGEGIISGEKKNMASHFVKFILGIDHQFTPRLYGLFEYHYNGEGKTDRTQYELLRLLRGEIINLGRHYALIQAVYMFHTLVNGSAMYTINMNDRSGFLGGNITYLMLQDFSLSAGGQMFYGKEFTEYWYYPLSLYVRADLYF